MNDKMADVLCFDGENPSFISSTRKDWASRKVKESCIANQPLKNKDPKFDCEGKFFEYQLPGDAKIRIQA